MKNPEGTERLVRISSVGYVTIYNRCAAGDLGTMQMQPDAQLLDEVVVKADLPVTHPRPRR